MSLDEVSFLEFQQDLKLQGLNSLKQGKEKRDFLFSIMIFKSFMSSPAAALSSINNRIDRVSSLSQSEIWLEIRTENYYEAKAYFEEQGYTIVNEIEPLADNFKGFWLNGPSNIIHLVSE